MCARECVCTLMTLTTLITLIPTPFLLLQLHVAKPSCLAHGRRVWLQIPFTYSDAGVGMFAYKTVEEEREGEEEKTLEWNTLT